MKLTKSLFLLCVLALCLSGCKGCFTDKQIVCGIVLLIANDECTQKQIQAQNAYNDAVLTCWEKHPHFPINAQGGGPPQNNPERTNCLNNAKAKLDAANREAENCRAKNKQQYDDCMNGK